MSDLNQAAPIQGTAPLSTTIDQGGALIGTGGGTPNLTPDKAPEPKPDAKPSKHESAGETLKGELARIKAEEAKEAEAVKAKGEDAAKDAKAKVDEAAKAEKDAKPDAKDADKAPKPEVKEPAAEADKSAADKPATGQEGEDKPRPSEGSKRNEPPARFLPKAKEVWGNVPHPVKMEIDRMAHEHEAEVAKYREAGDRYEQFRKYDELAKSNGRDFATDSLPKVIQFEEMMGKSPIAAIDFALREVGPRKTDGSILTLMDLVQFLQQNPQAYQQSVNSMRQPERQQERQPDPEIQALKQELQSMRTEHVKQSVIDPFAAQNPRYHELEADIAFFLSAKNADNSSKIPASLSPLERLEAAYDMAVRINPTSSSVPSQVAEKPADAKPAVPDPAGSKSIRGAPNGQDPDEDDSDATDIRKLLRRELRKVS